MPTLYLSNWSGHNTPGAHGPGRKWSIMARPRRWEKGEGSVPLLVPDADDLVAVQDGTMTPEAYREAYLRLVAYRIKKKRVPVAPGALLATTPLDPVPVAHGDSLLCACGVAEARAGRCHRTWAAGFLTLFGWDVVLDQNKVSLAEARVLLARENAHAAGHSRV